MQMYPSGGHTQHCYTGVLDDDNYFTMDDGVYHCNNNGFAQQSMQKTLDKGVPHPKQNYKWDNRKMQMYPSGGHTQHCHTGVQDDDDYFTMDDDDYHYNNNGFAHHDKGVPHSKQNYKWDNNYGKDEYKGCPPMSMTPDHRWLSPPKHNYKYNNMPSYGGSDQNFDNFRHRHEDYNVQYSEDWYEDEEDYNTWNGVNDHFGLGKHQDTNRYPGMSYGFEKSSGYGVHQGPHKPMVELRPYYIPVAPPAVWCAKGVKD